MARLIYRLALFCFVLIALVLPISPVYAADPEIDTDAATDVTESSAILNSTITDFGDYAGSTVYLFFEYCTDEYYDAYFGDYDKKTPEFAWVVSGGVTTYYTEISGLAQSTEYHFRAALRFGTEYSYGSDDTFTTAMLYPDSVPVIHSLQAYTDLLEPDDCLFVVLCDIPYNDLPSIPVNRAFVWSLMDTGTEQGWNTGYAMNDNGYGFNVYSLYFDAAAAIDWGNTTDYNVQLTGQPSAFYGFVPVYDSVDSANYAITSDTWVSTADYREKLAIDILAIASTLEQEWQVVLLDEQDTKTVLSSNGEKLFRNAIPGIQSMAPALFYVQVAETDVSARSWGTSLDTTYKERLLGVDGLPGGGDDNWVAGSLIGVADWMNIPWLLLVGLICGGCCVYVIYKSNQKFLTPVPGYIGALLIVICFAMLAMGVTVAAIIGLCLVIATGWLTMMRRA